MGKLTFLACNVSSYKSTALWTINVLFSLPRAPFIYVLCSKACGNLGLLGGLVAKLLGARLGRDNKGDLWKG